MFSIKEPSWNKYLGEEFNKSYMKSLYEKLLSSSSNSEYYPNHQNIFRAFEKTPLTKIKCVILGQDPYHQPGVAHGLSFSVNKETKIPASLKNIFKEINHHYPKIEFTHGDLSSWADQGVLLLNSFLTVAKGAPLSHQKWGWEKFTDLAISTINDQCDFVIFLLWGSSSIKKKLLIDENKHLILTAPHPSPLSAYRGFFGCNHFQIVNQKLIEHKIAEINWQN